MIAGPVEDLFCGVWNLSREAIRGQTALVYGQAEGLWVGFIECSGDSGFMHAALNQLSSPRISDKS